MRRTRRCSWLSTVRHIVVASSAASSALRRRSASLEGGERAEAQPAGVDDWIAGVKGTHRCLFDFPQHKNGAPLLHILNYLNTYSEAYKTGPGQAEPSARSTAWARSPASRWPSTTRCGRSTASGTTSGSRTRSGKPYTRNVFHKPTPNDLHLLMTAFQSPTIPAFGGAMPAIGIESLQKMGTTFLLCANAFGGWCQELGVRGKGKPEDLQKDLGANLLPGVVIVPAMVIAIERRRARASLTTGSNRRSSLTGDVYEDDGNRIDHHPAFHIRIVWPGERGLGQAAAGARLRSRSDLPGAREFPDPKTDYKVVFADGQDAKNPGDVNPMLPTIATYVNTLGKYGVPAGTSPPRDHVSPANPGHRHRHEQRRVQRALQPGQPEHRADPRAQAGRRRHPRLRSGSAGEEESIRSRSIPTSRSISGR